MRMKAKGLIYDTYMTDVDIVSQDIIKPNQFLCKLRKNVFMNDNAEIKSAFTNVTSCFLNELHVFYISTHFLNGSCWMQFHEWGPMCVWSNKVAQSVCANSVQEPTTLEIKKCQILALVNLYSWTEFSSPLTRLSEVRWLHTQRGNSILLSMQSMSIWLWKAVHGKHLSTRRKQNHINMTNHKTNKSAVPNLVPMTHIPVLEQKCVTFQSEAHFAGIAVVCKRLLEHVLWLLVHLY